MENVCAVVLAAGDGKRMNSQNPKVLCEVLFRPMVLWVADACRDAGILNCVAVLGKKPEMVQEILPPEYHTVLQQERKGTGHAVMMARDYVKDGGFADVAVLYGDTPFIRAEDLTAAYRQHKEQKNAVTVFSARVADPTGYGRIVRSANGVSAIVEHADADVDTLEIDEINAGVYWFNAGFLLFCLERMNPHNAQGEYYLTDSVAIAVKSGKRVNAYAANPATALGANDRKGLSLLNEMARKNIVESLLAGGVDIPFADQVVVGSHVTVGPDTCLLPGTILKGDTVIGSGCEIGPNSVLTDAVIGDNTKVNSSHVEQSKVGENAKIGPMSNIRPGCDIADGVKIGDFVEVKNSNIGKGTSISHLTYVGDSDVGERCNLGCGVVTVNYDGTHKYRTVVGSGSFIGCNANLIAPVTLGKRVYCAAGTTVTNDVPDDALVIGRSRQSIKENWNDGGSKYKRSNK